MTVRDPRPGRRDDPASDGAANGWVPDTGRYRGAGPEETGPARCPVCLAPTGAGARYCEACGQALFRASLVEGDDDHRELDLGPLAGVCDRGVRHATNEDAMGLAFVANTLVAVVCDGVSTTPGSDVASRAAAARAVEVIADAVRGQAPGQAGRTPRRDGRPSSDDVLDIVVPPSPRHGQPRRGEPDGASAGRPGRLPPAGHDAHDERDVQNAHGEYREYRE